MGYFRQFLAIFEQLHLVTLDKVDEKAAMMHDAKASLFSDLPDPGFMIYMMFNLAIWTLIWFAKIEHKQCCNPHYLAFLASVGPLILAQIMANITETGKRSMVYPFHKDGWKTLSSHLIISSLVCIGPVYILVHMLLADPGDSFYFWIRG